MVYYNIFCLGKVEINFLIVHNIYAAKLWDNKNICMVNKIKCNPCTEFFSQNFSFHFYTNLTKLLEYNILLTIWDLLYVYSFFFFSAYFCFIKSNDRGLHSVFFFFFNLSFQKMFYNTCSDILFVKFKYLHSFHLIS